MCFLFLVQMRVEALSLGSFTFRFLIIAPLLLLIIIIIIIDLFTVGFFLAEKAKTPKIQTE